MVLVGPKHDPWLDALWSAGRFKSRPPGMFVTSFVSINSTFITDDTFISRFGIIAVSRCKSLRTNNARAFIHAHMALITKPGFATFFGEPGIKIDMTGRGADRGVAVLVGNFVRATFGRDAWASMIVASRMVPLRMIKPTSSSCRLTS